MLCCLKGRSPQETRGRKTHFPSQTARRKLGKTSIKNQEEKHFSITTKIVTSGDTKVKNTEYYENGVEERKDNEEMIERVLHFIPRQDNHRETVSHDSK